MTEWRAGGNLEEARERCFCRLIVVMVPFPWEAMVYGQIVHVKCAQLFQCQFFHLSNPLFKENVPAGTPPEWAWVQIWVAWPLHFTPDVSLRMGASDRVLYDLLSSGWQIFSLSPCYKKIQEYTKSTISKALVSDTKYIFVFIHGYGAWKAEVTECLALNLSELRTTSLLRCTGESPVSDSVLSALSPQPFFPAILPLISDCAWLSFGDMADTDAPAPGCFQSAFLFLCLRSDHGVMRA